MSCLILCDYKLLEGRNNALYLSCPIHNSCRHSEKHNTGARYKLFGMNRSRNLEDQESLILSFLLAFTEMLSQRFLNSYIINFYRCHLFLRRYGALDSQPQCITLISNNRGCLVIRNHCAVRMDPLNDNHLTIVK